MPRTVLCSQQEDSPCIVARVVFLPQDCAVWHDGPLKAFEFAAL